MDLITIAKSLWRVKWVSLVLLLATIGGGIGVIVAVPPTYEATGSYLFFQPAAVPTTNPKTGEVESDNPFLRFGDPSVLLNVVARRVSDTESTERLVKKGASTDFTVQPSTRYGFSSPIIDINAQADSADLAINTVNLVGKAVADEVIAVQAEEGADARYMVTPRPIEIPQEATQRLARPLRMLLAVFALGGISMLMLAAIVQSWTQRGSRQTADPNIDSGTQHSLPTSKAPPPTASRTRTSDVSLPPERRENPVAHEPEVSEPTQPTESPGIRWYRWSTGTSEIQSTQSSGSDQFRDQHAPSTVPLSTIPRGRHPRTSLEWSGASDIGRGTAPSAGQTLEPPRDQQPASGTPVQEPKDGQ